MSAEEEIQAGLMNALERGVSIEKAVQSFINAGYSESSVRSAARAVSEGNVSFSHIDDSIPTPSPTSEIEPTPVPTPSPIKMPLPANPNAQVKRIDVVPEKKEGTPNIKIIILVVVLVLLLGILAASFFLKDFILSLLS